MKRSAGILLYRNTGSETEFLLAHPGGPFWKNKDAGAWSIPKGEFDEDEEPLAAAIREFFEETGILLSGEFTELSPVRMKSGKKVFAFAQQNNPDISAVVSNEFEIEWPPRSGKRIMIPEIDRVEWFSAAEALEKINAAQQDFIRQVAAMPR